MQAKRGSLSKIRASMIRTMCSFWKMKNVMRTRKYYILPRLSVLRLTERDGQTSLKNMRQLRTVRL